MSTPPALIPAAGRGTRLRPATRYTSKPMLPVGSRPIVDRVLREAERAGCSPIVVIGSRDDDDLRHFLQHRESAPGTDADVLWTEQPAPRGLAEALLRGYRRLENPKRVAMLLVDNLVLNGSGIESLLEPETDPDQLVFGTISVTREEAAYFGNSGGYEVDDENPPEVGERILRLQEKGKGNFQAGADDWPTRRATGRVLLPPSFFKLADRRDPDPRTGEIDDVPIYRTLLQDQPARGIPLDGDLYDVGQPNRYLRFCTQVFRDRQENFAL